MQTNNNRAYEVYRMSKGYTGQTSVYLSTNSGHKDSLEIGEEFQDFVARQLLINNGIVITNNCSKKYQFNNGENIQGFEIKYDRRSTGDCTYIESTPTGNVAIEVMERRNTDSNWVPSGIMREDNSWIYIVGNYHQLWLFGKKTLRRLCESKVYPAVVTKDTIMTMLLPIPVADEYCEKKIIFENMPNSI